MNWSLAIWCKFANFAALVSLVIAGGQAYAATIPINPKTCILAAAEKLPPIPGLIVAASRTAPLPASIKQEPGIAYLIAEFDVKAAGQDAILTYVCVTAPGKPLFVNPFGEPR